MTEYITAVEADTSLKKIIGEEVDLNRLFSPEKISACQKIIDDARNEFFQNELPKVEIIKKLMRDDETKIDYKVSEIVNDMRSQAKIFGFPFIVLACTHILSFYDDTAKPLGVKHKIISRFVEILHIAIKNKVRDEGGDLEKEMARLLK